MKICYFERSRIVIMVFFVIFMLANFFHCVNAVSVVRSKKPNGSGDVDTFSNPLPSCNAVGCSQVRGAAGCKNGNCCICKCGFPTPNYVIHSKECVTNELVEDCDYSTLPPDELIDVEDMSKAGSVPFEADVEICNELEVMQWMYQLDKPVWKKGHPNNFRAVMSRSSSTRWSLRWDRGLDGKYSGLILRFDLTCPGSYTRTGCLLVKSEGNYSRSEASSSSPPATAGPSGAMVETGRKAEPNAGSDNRGTSPSSVISGNNRKETFARTRKELAEKNHSVVAVGVSLSLVVGIGLICIILLRKGGPMWLDGHKGAQDAAYEEPVHTTAAGPGVRPIRTSVHNEFYDADCVLAIGGEVVETNNRTSRLGPLPPLPTQGESIYEVPVTPKIVRYHGLARGTGKPNEPTQAEPITKEQPVAVYNVLEPPSDEDDYDDTIEVRWREV